jgi:hypothetical protein
MEIREKINQVLRDWKLKAVNTNKAIDAILLLFGVSSHIFKVGDKVQWRGMDLIVVEVGVNEILIATSENVDDENYNDWWVGTQYVT